MGISNMIKLLNSLASTSHRVRKHVLDVTKTCSQPQDFDQTCLIELHDLQELIQKAIDVIMEQPMLLELVPPVNICGTY